MGNAAPRPSYFKESDKVLIPIKKLKYKEERTHYLFDANGLTKDIIKNGLKEPLIVEQEGEFYFVLDGRHRLAILRLLGWIQVPCYVVAQDAK